MLKFDWHIAPHRIEICARQNGEAWRLGSGGYGTVRLESLVCNSGS